MAEASTLAETLVSAVPDIEKVPGLRAVGVACDNMVTLSGIADRAGVTSEACGSGQQDSEGLETSHRPC